MKRTWLKIAAISVVMLAVVVVGVQTSQAQSRGRQSSPYVKTPFGWIPKSVYNQGFVMNPQTLENYRQREAAMQKQLQAQGQKRGTTGNMSPGMYQPGTMQPGFNPNMPNFGTTTQRKPTTKKK